MNISSVTNFVKQSSVKYLSGLANNSDSIIPMATKDLISDCAIVHTYKKEGGKDDARERFIEEFGTGAVWLFGIPLLKKGIDKFVYPKLGLNPKLDIRVLKDKDKVAQIADTLANNSNEALKEEKSVFQNLKNNPDLIKKYKNAYLGKFAFATAISAIALSVIIKHKQKTTQQRIENELNQKSLEEKIVNEAKFDNKKVSQTIVQNSVNANENFIAFTNAGKKDNQIAFKGLGELFLYNPIANTSLLDGVITGTRLLEARKGEKKEVFLKEAFQLLFIYGLAKPIQKGFEIFGKLLKAPIELDPSTLFDKNLKENVSKAVVQANTLTKEKNLSEAIHGLDIKSPLVKILSDNNLISTLKDKKGNITAISYFKEIDEAGVKKLFNNLTSLNDNIKNATGIKIFKVFAVLANVALAAWAMGVLQPKANILMRKVLNNGDNRNPAIVAQEKEIQKKLQSTQG